MRILLITSSYPTGPGDARGPFIQVLARALAEQGLEITVLAPGSPGAASREVDGDIRIHRARYWIPRWQGLTVGLGGIAPRLRRRPWLLVQVPFLIASLTRAALRLSRAADLVHAHWLYPAGIAGLAAARRAGIPLVVTSHGGDLNLARRSRLLRALCRAIALRADSCVGVSHAMVEELEALDLPPETVSFIPLGVDVSSEGAASRAHPLQERVRAGEAFKIVYVGSLIPRKSVHTLIDAHLELRARGHDVLTLLIGSGPEESALRKRAPGDGTVLFAGHQPPASIPDWIALGDVLVLPSRSEGRGLVLVEAMALGVPVVASEIPGPLEMISPGVNGLTFPSGDPVELAARLERLVLEPSFRARLGAQGKQYVLREGLTPEASARRHVELYRSLLAARAARPSG